MRGGKHESCVDEGVRARMLCNFASPDLIENPYDPSSVEYFNFEFGLWIESDRNVKLCRCCKQVIEPHKVQKHHVIPKSIIKHGSKKKRPMFATEDSISSRILVCRECHEEIHDRFNRYPRFWKHIRAKYKKAKTLSDMLGLRSYILEYSVVNHAKRSNCC